MTSKSQTRVVQRTKSESKRQEKRSAPVAEHSAENQQLRLDHALEFPELSRPADIINLQRKFGNQAVSGVIQAKLKVGPVNDHYEQEADRMAARVMSMTDRAVSDSSGSDKASGSVQRKPISASITPVVQRAPEEEEEMLQGKRSGQEAGFDASSSLEERLSGSRGSGSSLPDDVRDFMESRFGADFSGVRVHTGSDATGMTRGVQAKAFTRGRDIYFNSGEYDPASRGGKELLAHELTHVVQQTGSGSSTAPAGASEGKQRIQRRYFNGLQNLLGIEDYTKFGANANRYHNVDDQGRRYLAEKAPWELNEEQMEEEGLRPSHLLTGTDKHHATGRTFYNEIDRAENKPTWSHGKKLINFEDYVGIGGSAVGGVGSGVGAIGSLTDSYETKAVGAGMEMGGSALEALGNVGGMVRGGVVRHRGKQMMQSDSRAMQIMGREKVKKADRMLVGNALSGVGSLFGGAGAGFRMGGNIDKAQYGEDFATGDVMGAGYGLAAVGNAFTMAGSGYYGIKDALDSRKLSGQANSLSAMRLRMARQMHYAAGSPNSLAHYGALSSAARFAEERKRGQLKLRRIQAASGITKSAGAGTSLVGNVLKAVGAGTGVSGLQLAGTIVGGIGTGVGLVGGLGGKIWGALHKKQMNSKMGKGAKDMATLYNGVAAGDPYAKEIVKSMGIDPPEAILDEGGEKLLRRAMKVV